jgi:hypothetical protein
MSPAMGRDIGLVKGPRGERIEVPIVNNRERQTYYKALLTLRLLLNNSSLAPFLKVYKILKMPTKGLCKFFIHNTFWVITKI